MRIVLWSFLSFLASSILLLPEINASWQVPQQYIIVIPAIIIFLSLLIQLEAILFLKLKNSYTSLIKTNKTLEDNIKVNHEKLTKLNQKEKESSEKNLRLKKQIESFKNIENELSNKEKKLTLEKERNKTLTIALKNEEQKTKELIASKETEENKSKNQEVLTLLSLLQEKARFLDFVMDDVESYPDEQVGAAARIIHQGCKKILGEYFEIEPIHKEEEEGLSVKINTKTNRNLYKFIGNYEKNERIEGVLIHKGWMTKSVHLPKQIRDHENTNILAPAEIEFK